MTALYGQPLLDCVTSEGFIFIYHQGVLKTQLNIYVEILSAVNYFRKIAQSKIFYWVLNTPLLEFYTFILLNLNFWTEMFTDTAFKNWREFLGTMPNNVKITPCNFSFEKENLNFVGFLWDSVSNIKLESTFVFLKQIQPGFGIC